MNNNSKPVSLIKIIENLSYKYEIHFGKISWSIRTGHPQFMMYFKDIFKILKKHYYILFNNNDVFIGYKFKK